MSGYTGKCMRGSVQFEVSGEPCAMLACHCVDCRAYSASPVNGATAFKRDQLTVTQGKDLIQKYTSSVGYDRCWCSKCGGHVFLTIQRLIWLMSMRRS